MILYDIYYIKYGFSFDACRMYIGLIQVNSKLATKTRHLVLSMTLGLVPPTIRGSGRTRTSDIGRRTEGL